MSKKSTPSRPTRKAPKDFPLTRHPRGYWCKKVKGKLLFSGGKFAAPVLGRPSVHLDVIRGAEIEPQDDLCRLFREMAGRNL